VLHSTRRTLPLRPELQAPRLRSVAPIDAFESVAPVQQLAVAQSAQTVAPSSPSSSSGGFFSKLWGGIKNVAANLLGKAGDWLSNNVGGYITKAQTWV